MKKVAIVWIGALGWLVQSASAQLSLFTTTNDFGLFSNGGAARSSDYYSDSTAVNGLGNASPGAAGGVGSLQLIPPGGWGPFSDGPGVASNQGFLSAIDPGAVAAWSAGSGYGPGTLVAYSGTLSFDVYRGNLTDWNQFGVLFNYDGHWDNFFASTTSDFVGADGRTWTHCVVPYTVAGVSAGLSYFGFSISENASGNIAGETIYLDNIQVAAVPEPGALALLGLGALVGGACLRRRQARA
jgi:hypothetical protein